MSEFTPPAPPPPPNPYAIPVAPTGAYASWGQRVGAYLLDSLIGLVAVVPMVIGIAVMFSSTHLVTRSDGYIQEEPTGGALGLGLLFFFLAFVIGLAIWLWNRVFKQGRTGYSWGKGIVGIRLVKEETGQPTGAAWSLLREILHTVNSALCYLGWLWPLWDKKRQTFSDMISRTVVIRAPKA